MSRIGRKPIAVPDGVKVVVKGAHLEFKGTKGSVTLDVHPEMLVKLDEAGKVLVVERPSDVKRHKALHGLTRTLAANAVEGVSKGFSKELQIVGVGYNAKVQGKELVLQIGYSMPVKFPVHQDVQIQTPSPTQVVVTGVDKQRVGQVAAEIRRVRPPEPYKGKGIRYVDEVVRRKVGKALAGSAK